MKPRETQVWQFFTTDKEGRFCLVNEIECKAPERTKQWKELQWQLVKPYITEVGYQIKNNS
jgi:hypothetical protein